MGEPHSWGQRERERETGGSLQPIWLSRSPLFAWFHLLHILVRKTNERDSFVVRPSLQWAGKGKQMLGESDSCSANLNLEVPSALRLQRNES